MNRESYTRRTKGTVAMTRPGTTGQIRAELSALIRTCGALRIGRDGVRIELTSETSAVAERADELLSRLGLGATEDGGAAVRFNRKFAVRIIPAAFAPAVLEACRVMRGGHLIEGIDPELVDSEDDRRAFLRGAFLGGGTLNFANGYTLEFLFAREKTAEDFLSLLNELGVSARMVERNNRFVVYLKTAQEICDVLAHMGAVKAVIDIQTARAERMMKAKISRECNCEVFNTDKTVKAAERAILDIRTIAESEGWDSLDDKLRTVAEARLEDPGETLPALAERLGLTKSCVRHRLDKIAENAERIRLDSGRGKE